MCFMCFFFVKQKTAYEVRMSDGSSDGCSSDLASLIEMMPQAGERVELSGGDLRKDAVLLGDEARSTSLFGDSRHIVVRANGDDAHDALKLLIETGEAGDRKSTRLNSSH